MSHTEKKSSTPEQARLVDKTNTQGVTLLVGREIFSFDSERHWITAARVYYSRERANSDNTIAIDAHGRVVSCGKDFAQATKDGAYPVRVYVRRPGGAE